MRVAGMAGRVCKTQYTGFDSGRRLFDPPRVRKGQEGHVPGA
jgi:hypothetical protein